MLKKINYSKNNSSTISSRKNRCSSASNSMRNSPVAKERKVTARKISLIKYVNHDDYNNRHGKFSSLNSSINVSSSTKGTTEKIKEKESYICSYLNKSQSNTIKSSKRKPQNKINNSLNYSLNSSANSTLELRKNASMAELKTNYNTYKTNFLTKEKDFQKKKDTSFNLSIHSDVTERFKNDHFGSITQMIHEIGEKGLEKAKEDIIARYNEKYELERSIETLTRKINFYKRNKKHWTFQNWKVLNEIDQLKNTSARYKEMNNIIDKYQSGIEATQPMVSDLQRENIKLEKEINIEKRQIMLLKEQIKKMTKNVSDLKKEKENINNQLQITKKRNETLFTKLEQKGNFDKEIENYIADIYKNKLGKKKN